MDLAKQFVLLFFAADREVKQRKKEYGRPCLIIWGCAFIMSSF